MTKILSFILFIIFLSGCSSISMDSSIEENRPQPHRVNNGTPMKEHLTYYEDFVDARELQKENLADSDFDHYTDPYTTEETQRISKKLMENRDIINVEVRMDEEQVFVAVKLRENNYDRNQDTEIVTEIEQQVRDILIDDTKQVIIYTDHTQWQRLKNHHS